MYPTSFQLEESVSTREVYLVDMNSMRAVFTQDLIDKVNLHRYIYETKGMTSEVRDSLYLKAWASRELFALLKVYHGVGVKTFNLMKPIMVKVFWNDSQEVELVQVRVTKDRIIRRDTDFPYKVKNGIYLLISTEEYKLTHPSKESLGDKFVVTDLSRLLNAIEHSAGMPSNYRSPILYTGMTN